MIKQSFIEWVYSLPSSMEIQELIVFFIAGSIGVFSHFLKKKFCKELTGSFYNYLVGDHPAYTILALSTFWATAFTYIFSGTIDSASWPTTIGLALTTGYSLDSVLNKGSK